MKLDCADRASGGKLVDASPATEKALTDELEKLARVYGAKGDDFTKFPTFSFSGELICGAFLSFEFMLLCYDHCNDNSYKFASFISCAFSNLCNA